MKKTNHHTLFPVTVLIAIFYTIFRIDCANCFTIQVVIPEITEGNFSDAFSRHMENAKTFWETTIAPTNHAKLYFPQKCKQFRDETCQECIEYDNTETKKCGEIHIPESHFHIATHFVIYVNFIETIGIHKNLIAYPCLFSNDSTTIP